LSNAFLIFTDLEIRSYIPRTVNCVSTDQINTLPRALIILTRSQYLTTTWHCSTLRSRSTMRKRLQHQRHRFTEPTTNEIQMNFAHTNCLTSAQSRLLDVASHDHIIKWPYLFARCNASSHPNAAVSPQLNPSSPFFLSFFP